MARFMPALPVLPRAAIPLMAAGACGVGAAMMMGNVLVSSAPPHQWLLVVRNGQQHYAAVGGRSFHRWTDQVVRFPSQLQRVTFTALQVTKEMQGVEVRGFLCWSVFRGDNGPLKAYSNLGFSSGPEPTHANENLGQLAESIIRAQVANSTIVDVLQKRSQLREAVRTEIQEVAKGWGIWLETVEITDVHISSKQLFSDMQAPFRQKQHLEAEDIRMQTETELAEIRLRTETEMADKRATTETEVALHASRMTLKRQAEEEKINEEKDRIERRRIESAHELELAKIAADKIEDDARFEAELQRQNRTLEQETKMSDRSLEMARLRTAEGVYKALPIRDVKLFNVGPDAGVEGLVTRFATAMQEVK